MSGLEIALAAVSVATGVVGAATQISSARAQASAFQQQAVAAQYQAQATQQATNFQAQVLEQQAQREQDVAALQAGDFQREQRELIARQRLRLSASGVRLDEGTPLLLQSHTAGEIERGVRRILHAGDISAQRTREEARLQRFTGESAVRAGGIQSAGLMSQASGARTAGFLGAGASLLGGARGAVQAFS